MLTKSLTHIPGTRGTWVDVINSNKKSMHRVTWWRHQMETFYALLAFCAGNSPVPGEFPAQRPVTRSFGVFFNLRLNKRLSKQSWGWWFETLSSPLWCHCNEYHRYLTSQPVPCKVAAYVYSKNKEQMKAFLPPFEQSSQHVDIVEYVSNKFAVNNVFKGIEMLNECCFKRVHLGVLVFRVRRTYSMFW